MNPLSLILQTQAATTQAAPQLIKLKDSCDAMQANFLKSLVQQMRKGTGEVHFGEELGGDIYRDMFDDALSNILAQKQTMGMTKALYGPLASQVFNQQLRAVQAAAKASKDTKNS